MTKKKKYKTDSFTKAELQLMAELFARFEHRFDSYDEYKIEATPANKDLICHVIEWGTDPRDAVNMVADVEESKDEILTTDTDLYGYFAARCHHLANK